MSDQSEIRELETLGTLASGNTPSKANPDYWNGTIPWITAKDLKRFELSTSIDKITPAAVGAKLTPPGSVLVLVRGMGLFKGVPIGLATTELAFNQDVKAFVPSSGVDGRFIAYALMAAEPVLRSGVTAAGHGTGRLNIDQLQLLPIRVPPLSEQRRIVAILDEWDRAIATAEKLVQSQQRRKSGLIKSIFFGASNWFDASISELADVVGGGTPSTNKRAYWDGDIPWCTPTDITGLDTRYIETTERTISETGLAASNATLLPVGSIILCSRASVGECAINLVPMATNQGFQSLVPKDQNDRYFLYYLVQAYKPELIRLSAGSTFMEFPKSALRTMSIRIPEAQKRQEIGLLFNDIDDELDQTVALLERLRLQKRGLMQKLLSGDWPVPASIDRLLPGRQDIDEAVEAEVRRAEATG